MVRTVSWLRWLIGVGGVLLVATPAMAGPVTEPYRFSGERMMWVRPLPPAHSSVLRILKVLNERTWPVSRVPSEIACILRSQAASASFFSSA